MKSLKAAVSRPAKKKTARVFQEEEEEEEEQEFEEIDKNQPREQEASFTSFKPAVSSRTLRRNNRK